MGFPKTTTELVNECFERLEAQCGRYPENPGLKSIIPFNAGWFKGKRNLALDVLYEIRHTRECIETANEIRKLMEEGET